MKLSIRFVASNNEIRRLHIQKLCHEKHYAQILTSCLDKPFSLSFDLNASYVRLKFELVSSLLLFTHLHHLIYEILHQPRFDCVVLRALNVLHQPLETLNVAPTIYPNNSRVFNRCWMQRSAKQNRNSAASQSLPSSMAIVPISRRRKNKFGMSNSVEKRLQRTLLSFQRHLYKRLVLQSINSVFSRRCIRIKRNENFVVSFAPFNKTRALVIQLWFLTPPAQILKPNRNWANARMHNIWRDILAQKELQMRIALVQSANNQARRRRIIGIVRNDNVAEEKKEKK